MEQRKLAAIMFTDIVGFSHQMGLDENHALELLDKHNKILNRTIENFNGHTLKHIGDSIFAEFDSSTNAVNCAIDIQTQLKQYNTDETQEDVIAIRIGIHIGEVVIRDDDLFGDGINIASRLEPLAEPGGICISQEVYKSIKAHLDIKPECHGEVRLKNIEDNQIIYQFRSFYPDKVSISNVKHTPTENKSYGYVVIVSIVLITASLIWWNTSYSPTIETSDILSLPNQASNNETLVEKYMPEASIAVLPFVNMSSDPEQEYFSDGISEELMNLLAKIPNLQVAARTSSFAFKGMNQNIQNIAKQLGVKTILVGSIRRAGTKVRITAQLIKADDGFHLWSDTYDRELDDIFEIQDEISTAIVSSLKETLGIVLVKKSISINDINPINPIAYESILKGQFHIERFTPSDMKLAIQYYEQALQLEPDYALAYVGLSKLCSFRAQAGIIKPKQAREQCLPLIQKALALDDSLPEAHLGYATHMTWQRFNWQVGEAAFQRAIELNPSYAEARMFYSHFLTLMGREEEGTKQMRLALKLDPLNPFVQALYGAQLVMIDDFQGAIRVIEDVFTSTPGFGFGYFMIFQAYHALGEKDKAIAAAVNYFRITKGNPITAMALEKASVDKNYSSALQLMAEVIAEHSKTVHVQPTTIGVLYDHAGNIEKAIDWYEIAYQEYDPRAPYLGVITESESLQSNPRFIKLLKNMKLDYWVNKFSQLDN